jgi:hypothetical protein
VSACVGTEKLSPFQLGIHHFNPPLKTNSHKRDNEVLHQRGKSLGDEQCIHTLKDKGMQTQYEVNNFSRVTFLSKVESFFSSTVWIWPIYILQMELKGRVRMFLVYGRSRIMDLLT